MCSTFTHMRPSRRTLDGNARNCLGLRVGGRLIAPTEPHTLGLSKEAIVGGRMTQGTQGPTGQQVPSTWDAVAEGYATAVSQWTGFAEEALGRVSIAPTDRVLDVASGPGTLAFPAARKASRVDAVDFSPEMIAQLRARAEREGIRNIHTAVMDAQSLEFGDGTFDLACCAFAFFFFPDRAKAFRELHRVLKPGGHALVLTWGPIERRPLMKVAFDALAEAMPHLPRPTKGDLQSPEECIREMSEAGFRELTSEPFTSSYRFDSPEHYAQTMIQSGAPFAVMRKSMPPSAWQPLVEGFIGALRTRIPPGGTDLVAEAVITVGTR